MAKTYTREEFTREFSPYISSVTQGTGILPGILLAQAILESSGKIKGEWKVGGSRLAREANNFFGIKADSRWTGDVYGIETKEYTKEGKPYTVIAKFRKYPSVQTSIKDYVSFLKSNPRYERAGVFKAMTTIEQAEALKRAGYATDPKYPQLISSVYESTKKFIAQRPIATAGIGIAGIIVLGIGGYYLYRYVND